jgi:NAD(P)-dependent dehydrogenase (short-subunit alcohol dehydrogenase family)
MPMNVFITGASSGIGAELAREFKRWVEIHPKEARPRALYPKGRRPRLETKQEVLDRMVKKFRRESGLFRQVEDAGDRDPVTGKVANPNAVFRTIRRDMVEIYGKNGTLDARQYNAAKKLRDACDKAAKSKGVDLAAVRVDITPDPDAAIMAMLTNNEDFQCIWVLVPDWDRPILDALCRLGCGPSAVKIGLVRPYRTGHAYQRGLVHMQAACERLADRLGL